MNRRGFISLLGAATALTAAGLAVPDVARRFFLPPTGGWRPERYSKLEPTGVTIEVWGGGGGGGGTLQMGDIITFGPTDPRGNVSQFIVLAPSRGEYEVYTAESFKRRLS